MTPMLAEHLPLRGGTACECGWSAGLSLNDTRSDAKQHLTHLAAVVAEWLTSEQTFVVAEVAIMTERDRFARVANDADSGEVAEATLAALAAHAKGEADE